LPRRDPAGDTRFEREALPWLDDVYRFSLSLTRNEADAHDVVQDTFLRAYRSWHTFLPGSDARRWLFTIARNVFLRTRERERRQVALDDGDAEALDAVRVHARMIRDDTEALVRGLDLRPALAAALAELEEPFRSAVILVDVEDQSYDAAAEMLGVPIGTVRSRLFRGRRILQEKLVAVARDAGLVPGSPNSRESR
jgi:RNA polymerase sigma-70 factor (ECF subfamily)